MPEFFYVGMSRGKQEVKGVINAKDEVDARMRLREQQIRTLKLTPRNKGVSMDMDLSQIGGSLFAQKVKFKDLVVFTRQFSVMIEAGLPQVTGLDILAKQSENPALRKVLTTIKEKVEQGSTFNSALAEHPKVFDNLYVNLIAAAEMGGVMDVILRRLADYLEKANALAGKIKGALFYPAAILSISLIIVAFLLTVVVPKVTEFITSAGGEIPFLTLLVMGASNFLLNNKIMILVSMVAAFMLAKWFLTLPETRKKLDAIFLRLPLFGSLIRKTAVARFTRTMGILIQSGVPILDALDICAKVSGNFVVQTALQNAKIAISEGKPIATPLEQSGVFPPMVTQMISVGEKTGALDQLLSKIADFYDEEVDTAVKTMTSLIEPLMMVFLGAILGVIVIALYLPIFNMASSVGN